MRPIIPGRWFLHRLSMRLKHRRFVWCWGMLLTTPLLLLSSCASHPTDHIDYSNEPIGMQILRAEPSLRGKRFNTLLDFESPNDLVFVSSHPPVQSQPRHAHTGKLSANFGSAAKVNLGSVMVDRTFPGDWTLAGGYLWSDRPAIANVRCTVNGMEAKHTVELPGGKWTPAFVDLTQMTPMPASMQADASAEPSLTFNANQQIDCDDVMLIDNDEYLLGGPGATDTPWSIRRRGFRITGDRPGWFTFTLETANGQADGWKVEEVSPMRARFSSNSKTRRLTIYSDGRSYWDGVFKPLSEKAQSDPALARAHESPAVMKVPEGAGRVNRSSKGDANNDGYNESLGAYELTAKGARIEVTIIPQSVEIVRPILEIAGLPQGKALVTLEGRLIESDGRVPNGNLLIEVPARIQRPTTLNVRIE
jgi:hypothetical protein